LRKELLESIPERSGLRKEITNMKNNVKMLQKELERLTHFEHSFMQASAKIETLEAEL